MTYSALTVSLAILYFVLRYRVHVHVTYTPRPARKPAAHGRLKPGVKAVGQVARSEASGGQGGLDTRRSSAPALTRDLISALRNLGARPAAARAAAERAARECNDFEPALRLAMQYATERKKAA